MYVQQVFVYMGAYVQHEEWLGNAYKGWPLGEMLQWSDLIASLYVLGHNVTISAERKVMNRYSVWFCVGVISCNQARN